MYVVYVIFIFEDGQEKEKWWSLICFTCKNNKDSSDAWKEAHILNCSINHEGCSGRMEKDGSVEIFLRSIGTRKLCHTTFVGDGGSSSLGAVANAVTCKYGDQYPVEKKDCIGNIIYIVF